MDSFDLFWRGLILGFSIAAPVGPIGVLCIQRSLAHGRRAGFVSGLGAATADAVYGSVAAFGLAGLAAFLVGMQFWLGLVGGIFLVFLGLKTFFSRAAGDAEGGGQQAGRMSTFALYASTFGLTITNPMTILSFTAIFAGFGVGAAAESLAPPALVVLGVFLGSAAWWLLLSGLAGQPRWRGVFGAAGRTWINRLSGVIIVVFGVLILAGLRAEPASLPAGSVQPADELNQSIDLADYARAAPGQALVFPQDFGPHPDFQTEWWYYTGNLEGPQGERFGYQLTFFRRAMLPPSLRAERESTWAVEQVYLAHFALTDVSGGQHYAVEKMSRGAAGLAGAQAEPYRVWLETWSVVENGPGSYLLSAEVPAGDGHPSIMLVLELRDVKGPVLQGIDGYSQKGPDAGNASYYYSQTRLESSGEIWVGDSRHIVNGWSWKDHEYSTSALAPDQVGWDWFSIQLDDGSELMFFQIRQEDGEIDPFSSGSLITPEGEVIRLAREDFEIEVLARWQSPNSGGDYPAAWQVSIPKAGIVLDIRPLLADQELDLQYTYWEGAVRVSGQVNGSAVSGFGYVEMTGYAGTMAGEF